MKEVYETQMKTISGGALTASFLNAFVRGVSVFLDLGQIVGSSIRRISAGNYCSF